MYLHSIGEFFPLFTSLISGPATTYVLVLQTAWSETVLPACCKLKNEGATRSIHMHMLAYTADTWLYYIYWSTCVLHCWSTLILYCIIMILLGHSQSNSALIIKWVIAYRWKRERERERRHLKSHGMGGEGDEKEDSRAKESYFGSSSPAGPMYPWSIHWLMIRTSSVHKEYNYESVLAKLV